MDDSQEDSPSKIQAFTSSAGYLFENKATVFVLLGFIFVLFINVIVVDVLFFSSRQKSSNDNLILQRISGICPQSCVTKFSDLTTQQSAQKTIETSSQSAQLPNTISTVASSPTLTLTSTPIPTATSIPTPISTLHEYFIPLGQGSGSYTDWTVVPGIGAKVNMKSYGNIEKVYFEATVRVPAGSQTVYVRLYNANSLQSIVDSDLTLASNTSTLLTSKAISLTDTKDENLYQVQLKTQLGSTTYIDQARLHILAR
ncbi:MAG: hypothetical protein HYV37_03660 [Candidatus Levyibacteriota bacterium]|nr:MAG: hypothetical protein HYV37_03660 [Candidatus Levybacteria bacterium]